MSARRANDNELIFLVLDHSTMPGRRVNDNELVLDHSTMSGRRGNDIAYLG